MDLLGFFSPENIELFGQLLLALLLGAAIGIERRFAGKEAGARTFGLVSLGSALFSIVSIDALRFVNPIGIHDFDPTHIAAQIVSGVGFIGAGVIIFDHEKLRGVTTAAGLWFSAAVGMAVGFRLYSVAVFSTVLALLVFVVFWFLEETVIARSPYENGDQKKK